ncbi:MAG: hypothetical protein ABIF77_14725 [bacterium]
MAADGVSLQTSLSQLGNVARTQVKSQQQANQNTTTFSEQVGQSKDLKVNRVKKAEKADKGKIDPDAEKDRQRAQQEAAEEEKKQQAAEQTGEENDAEEQTDTAQEIGLNIDTRA